MTKNKNDSTTVNKSAGYEGIFAHYFHQSLFCFNPRAEICDRSFYFYAIPCAKSVELI